MLSRPSYYFLKPPRGFRTEVAGTFSKDYFYLYRRCPLQRDIKCSIDDKTYRIYVW